VSTGNILSSTLKIFDDFEIAVAARQRCIERRRELDGQGRPATLLLVILEPRVTPVPDNISNEILGWEGVGNRQLDHVDS
jgi:hypothetical protein